MKRKLQQLHQLHSVISSISFINSIQVINALPLPKNPPHGTPSAFAEDLFEVWRGKPWDRRKKDDGFYVAQVKLEEG